MSDHDPFNEPELAHPRARELMAEDFFWDCADEGAPFGSDEGFDAYYEWRAWRAENPSNPLTDCLSWILVGRLDEFNESLCSDEQIQRDLEDPDSAFLADAYDIFTVDTTIIATALGQLLDEGSIDAGAKQFVNVAIRRQLHPGVAAYDRERLFAIQRVVDAA